MKLQVNLETIRWMKITKYTQIMEHIKSSAKWEIYSYKYIKKE